MQGLLISAAGIACLRRSALLPEGIAACVKQYLWQEKTLCYHITKESLVL